MGDGEVGNELDSIFPSLSTRRHVADECDASPNPARALKASCHSRQPRRKVSERRRRQQRVLFINGAREAANEA